MKKFHSTRPDCPRCGEPALTGEMVGRGGLRDTVCTECFAIVTFRTDTWQIVKYTVHIVGGANAKT